MNRRFRALALSVVCLIVLAGMALIVLFYYPRPPDTTDPGVFAADGAALDYCALPRLDGSGARAEDIPKAYTPGCGWSHWPMPVLAACREPLAEGVVDLRGLWLSTTEGIDHVERIEQCGNRTVVTSTGIIHDFITDGTLANGSRDIEPPSCMNTWVAIDWQAGVMGFHPFGLPFNLVTRQRRGEALIWTYPRAGTVHMRRICRVPEAFRVRTNQSQSRMAD